MSSPPTESTMREWRQFLTTPAGLRYLAQRVRIGSRAIVRELDALDNWLRARAIFNPRDAGKE